MPNDNQRSAVRGLVLLEALLALAILSIAGLSAIGVVQHGLDQERRALAREHEVVEAARVLTALTLLTRTDLDQRLGRRRIGEFVAGIQRPEPALYRLAVAEAAHPDVELLVTVVYRARAP